MDPWREFEDALDGRRGSDEVVARLRSLVDSLKSRPPSGRSEADIQELRSAAVSMLARYGATPLESAVKEAKHAWELGRPAWAGLYLAEAGAARSDPAVVLEGLAQIPKGYFDAENLHWRSIEADLYEAEARAMLGDRRRLSELVRRLNTEYATEPDDQIWPVPARLATLLLEDPSTHDLLQGLVRGLRLQDWFEESLAARISNATG